MTPITVQQTFLLPTIWHVPDPLWDLAEALIQEFDPPKSTGRKRINPRAALDANIFRIRTGCQWNHLPKEFPDDSSVHRTFQRWRQQGLFARLWATLVEHCDALGAVDWQWQATDGGHWQGPNGWRPDRSNPTDRAKNGTKRSLHVDGQGGPLAIVPAGANVHDTKLLRPTLEAIIVKRPEPTKNKPKICASTKATIIPPDGPPPRAWDMFPTSAGLARTRSGLPNEHTLLVAGSSRGRSLG